MTIYHKIETPFTRDMEGTKKLVEGSFRNECVEYLKDNEWTFTEKVDGTNIRVIWDGHKVRFAGRSDNADIHGTLIERLQEYFQGNTNEELFEEKFGETPVVFYGEGYGGKIQKGSAYRPTPDFIMFDVKVGDIWLERENILEIAKAFNVDVVPVLVEGTIEDAVGYMKTKPNSVVAKEDKVMEGLIGTPNARLTDFRGNRIITKIKECDF